MKARSLFATVAIGCIVALPLEAVQRAGDNTAGAEFAAAAPDSARRVSAVIVLSESRPGPERPPERPFVDLAVGRFRESAWRKLAQTWNCGLLYLRLGTIRSNVSVPANVVRSWVVAALCSLFCNASRKTLHIRN
jgi:hypothetical protein